MTAHKEVELRSEEVQEVMGQIPSWIVRWGITILFLVVVTLLIGSCFFKYPDVIAAEMTLTSPHPAVQVVARASGRISLLYAADGGRVAPGESLAVIENPALTGDMDRLRGLLGGGVLPPDSAIGLLMPAQELSLGEVQADYVNYLRCLHEYANYRTLDYYPRKMASVQGQIAKYRVYYANLNRQKQVMESQHTLAGQQYTRDSLLLARQVISPSEHETARSEWLQSRYSLEGAAAALENLKIQIGQLEESLLDLDLERMEKENVLLQEYRSAAEQLQNAMNSWELNYRLTTPIAGQITFTKYWNQNQYVTAGETVFSIVPEAEARLMGVALLPVQRSGKVKVGQRVIIRLANYPDQEFGVVNGVVGSISLVPNANNYRVEISLPDGLTTNYKRSLPAAHEMQATAEIVTDDLRLIERFFMPIKKILREGF